MVVSAWLLLEHLNIAAIPQERGLSPIVCGQRIQRQPGIDDPLMENALAQIRNQPLRVPQMLKRETSYLDQVVEEADVDVAATAGSDEADETSGRRACGSDKSADPSSLSFSTNGIMGQTPLKREPAYEVDDDD